VDEFDGAIAIVLVVLAAYEALVAILTLRSAHGRGEPLIRERMAWIRVALSVIFAMAAIGALFSLTEAYLDVLYWLTFGAFGAMILLLLAGITKDVVRGIRRIGRTEEPRPPRGTGETMGASESPSRPTVADEDPGWSDAWTSAIPFVGPIIAATRGDRRRTQAVVGLRTVFILVLSSLLFFAISIFFIAPWQGDDPVPLWAPALVIGQGVVTVELVRRIRKRPLETGDAAALADSYRSSMWMGIGLSHSVALVAFLLVLFIGSSWVYVLGMGFAALGIAMSAPTGRDIERRQEELDRAGVPLSLLRLLNRPPRTE